MVLAQDIAPVAAAPALHVGEAEVSAPIAAILA